jgi:hypothetical protein
MDPWLQLPPQVLQAPVVVDARRVTDHADCCVRGDSEMTELLTAAEHQAMQLTAELVSALKACILDGPTRDQDLRELIDHIHPIQNAILANAAGRAYPDQYRLLGGVVAGGGITIKHDDDWDDVEYGVRTEAVDSVTISGKDHT